MLPSNGPLAISTLSFDIFFYFFLIRTRYELLVFGDLVSGFHLMDMLVGMEFINTIFLKMVFI